MTNTIELLGTIGESAPLRHAGPENLAARDASKALQRAASLGGSGYLTQRLGYRALQNPNHIIQATPGREDIESGGDDVEITMTWDRRWRTKTRTPDLGSSSS